VGRYRNPTARETLEEQARVAVGRRYAAFTWSLSYAVEEVLSRLDLPPMSGVGVPFSSDAGVVAGVNAAGHVCRPLPTCPISLQLDPDGLRDALAAGDLAAVVAWRPAGGAPLAELMRVLEHVPVPVIDALPRTAGGDAVPMPYAVATCIAVAELSALGGVIAADDPVFLPVRPDDAGVAALDRWAGMALAATGSVDPVAQARLTAGHELLLNLIDSLPDVHAVRSSISGWGGPPETLLAFSHLLPDDVTERFAGIGAIDARSWWRAAPVEWVDAAAAGDDPCLRVVTVRWTRSPSDHDLRSIAAIQVDPTGGETASGPRPVAVRSTPPSYHLRGGLGGRVAKRTFDLVVGSLLLAVCSPLIAAVAALVRLIDGSPVLFRQVRVGRFGVPFEMLKFRTMVPEAQQRLGHLQHRNERAGPLFKLADDPRETKLGRVLRRCSLDELPQLWNVVQGTMSLVGPRPSLPRERLHFPHDLLQREAVRPGLTGLWQVTAREDASFDRYMQLDLDYVHNHSLRRDVDILRRTPRTVFEGMRTRRDAVARQSGSTGDLRGPVVERTR
jgi:lipopolysaccharide/colanic/teichoic acid biosynthesis glycosyltransferase